MRPLFAHRVLHTHNTHNVARCFLIKYYLCVLCGDHSNVMNEQQYHPNRPPQPLKPYILRLLCEIFPRIALPFRREIGSGNALYILSYASTSNTHTHENTQSMAKNCWRYAVVCTLMSTILLSLTENLNLKCTRAGWLARGHRVSKSCARLGQNGFRKCCAIQSVTLSHLFYTY